MGALGHLRPLEEQLRVAVAQLGRAAPEHDRPLVVIVGLEVGLRGLALALEHLLPEPLSARAVAVVEAGERVLAELGHPRLGGAGLREPGVRALELDRELAPALVLQLLREEGVDRDEQEHAGGDRRGGPGAPAMEPAPRLPQELQLALGERLAREHRGLGELAVGPEELRREAEPLPLGRRRGEPLAQAARLGLLADPAGDRGAPGEQRLVGELVDGGALELVRDEQPPPDERVERGPPHRHRAGEVRVRAPGPGPLRGDEPHEQLARGPPLVRAGARRAPPRRGGRAHRRRRRSRRGCSRRSRRWSGCGRSTAPRARTARAAGRPRSARPPGRGCRSAPRTRSARPPRAPGLSPPRAAPGR